MSNLGLIFIKDDLLILSAFLEQTLNKILLWNSDQLEGKWKTVKKGNSNKSMVIYWNDLT